MVKAGEKITIETQTSDPDHNTVSLKFWQYQEAGTCLGSVKIENSTPEKAQITIPDSASKGQTIHIIVEGKDNGEPALIRYQRVILKIS
jgi:hypothetical protein